jgi:hypothetical protein
MESMEKAAMDGMDIGVTTEMRVLTGPRPSVRAASIMASGMESIC